MHKILNRVMAVLILMGMLVSTVFFSGQKVNADACQKNIYAGIVYGEENPTRDVESGETNVEIKIIDEYGIPVEDAVLQIVDKDNNEIKKWITTVAPEEINGILNVGEEYILRELETAAGYEKADDQLIFITYENKTIELTMVNKKKTEILNEVIFNTMDGRIEGFVADSPKAGDCLENVRLLFIVLVFSLIIIALGIKIKNSELKKEK